MLDFECAWASTRKIRVAAWPPHPYLMKICAPFNRSGAGEGGELGAGDRGPVSENRGRREPYFSKAGSIKAGTNSPTDLARTECGSMRPDGIKPCDLPLSQNFLPCFSPPPIIRQAGTLGDSKRNGEIDRIISRGISQVFRRNHCAESGRMMQEYAPAKTADYAAPASRENWSSASRHRRRLFR